MIQSLHTPPDRGIDASEPAPRRWSREEYYRLIDFGFFENQRVELIQGSIIEMAPQRVPHSVALELVDRYLRKAFGKGFRIRIQSPFRAAGDSDPEPDIAVLAGDDPRAGSEHPAEAVLIVEISDSSIRHGRRKAAVYAASGVGEYWILNLGATALEVYRGPLSGGGSAEGPAYADVHVYAAGDSIAPVAAPDAPTAIGDLLP